jgi:ketosteroid isomerase-like protein
MPTHRNLVRCAPLAALLVLAACESTPVSSASRAPAAQPARNAAESPDPGRVREYIEAANARLIQHFVAGDAAGAASMFTDDAILMLAGAPAATGTAEIERLFAGTFAVVRFRSVQAEILEVTVAGDMAYEVGKTVMTYEAGGQTYREMGKYLVAWKRLPGGEWKIHRDVSNSSGFLP